ncbi:hypothetical protein HanIR_Chr16g0840731 [Helianthus annuus]|nr:hypothetical protein HanIR_Chr16g0840731 [Helianthus annuus]
MENLKKKRLEVTDGRLSGKKIRSKKERSNGGVTADDAELDEFLAILNRLQAGFNHFQEKSTGKAAVKPPATFELGDFSFQDGGRKISTGDTPQNDDVVGFDLNADPVFD